MCDEKVGVAKRIEVERISKDVSNLVKILEKEISNETVTIDVPHVRRVTKGLDSLVAAKP